MAIYIPAFSSLPIKYLKFNGGEIQVNIKDILDANLPQPLKIVANLKQADELFVLAQIKTILDRNKIKSELELPYIPYGRSDRAMVEGECSGLKVFTSILNTLGFSSIKTVDPHSDVTEALVENIEIKTQPQALIETFGSIENIRSRYDFIVCPDSGASKKSQAISVVCGLPLIEASKVRDVATGLILKTAVNANGVDLEGKSLLIVDDLAEFAGTHSSLAKILKDDHKVKTVDLYVTHGLFPMNFRVNPSSRFSGPLSVIDNIFTYALWQNEVNEVLPKEVHKLFEFI